MGESNVDEVSQRPVLFWTLSSLEALRTSLLLPPSRRCSRLCGEHTLSAQACKIIQKSEHNDRRIDKRADDVFCGLRAT